MSVPPDPCPNCGLPLPMDVTVCSNCGFVRSSPAATRRVDSTTPAEPRLVTGWKPGDVVLGIGIVVLPCFTRGRFLGLELLMPIFYFVLRPTFPFLARGIGFGILTGLALLLGALALCAAFVFSNRH